MTVKLSLTPEEERMLLCGATEKGQDVADYLHTLVEEDLKRPPALSEFLAPIPRGISSKRHDRRRALCAHQGAREEVWQEKQRGKATP